MATLSQLAAIQTDPGWGTLVEKIRAAAVVTASKIIDDVASTPQAVRWARQVLSNPASGPTLSITQYLVGKNSEFTIAQIIGVSDAAIQSGVDAAASKMAEVSEA